MGAFVPLRGHLAMSGDILPGQGGGTGAQWLESKDAARHPTSIGQPPQYRIIPNVSGVRLKNCVPLAFNSFLAKSVLNIAAKLN